MQDMLLKRSHVIIVENFVSLNQAFFGHQLGVSMIIKTATTDYPLKFKYYKVVIGGTALII